MNGKLFISIKKERKELNFRFLMEWAVSLSRIESDSRLMCSMCSNICNSIYFLSKFFSFFWHLKPFFEDVSENFRCRLEKVKHELVIKLLLHRGINKTFLCFHCRVIYRVQFITIFLITWIYAKHFALRSFQLKIMNRARNGWAEVDGKAETCCSVE